MDPLVDRYYHDKISTHHENLMAAIISVMACSLGSKKCLAKSLELFNTMESANHNYDDINPNLKRTVYNYAVRYSQDAFEELKEKFGAEKNERLKGIFLESLTFTTVPENIKILIDIGSGSSTNDNLRNIIFTGLLNSEYAVHQAIQNLIDDHQKYEMMYDNGWIAFPSFIQKGNYSRKGNC